MLNRNQQLKSLAKDSDDKNFVFNLLTIAKEFGMNYKEMMSIPIPAYYMYVEYLNEINKKKPKPKKR